MPPPRLDFAALLGLVDPKGVLDDLAAAEGLAEFWWQGGARFSEPLGDGRGAVGLLLQPDGDVVLMLPPGFGDAAGDKDLAKAMIARAVTRIAETADHYGAAVRDLAQRALTLGLVPVWAAGVLGTLALNLHHLRLADCWPLIGPPILSGLRAAFGHKVVPALARWLFEAARGKALGALGRG